MKISVITVCLNAKDSIEKTFESLKNQTYKNVEHIVIDGASIDGTLDIINKYKDSIAHFVSEKDSGIYNAMNKGLKYVTGDIVYFLNATDSLYNDEVLEKIVNEFKNHPDLEMLWGDIQFTEKGKEPRVHKNNDVTIKSDFLYNNPCHQSIFYKSELFKKYGDYDEDIKIFGDCDFNVRVLVTNNAKCKYIPEVVACFEIGGISTSSEESDRLLHKADRLKVYNKNFKHKFCYRADVFITKNFATPARIIKKSKVYYYLFNLIDYISKAVFKKRLKLNFIDYRNS